MKTETRNKNNDIFLFCLEFYSKNKKFQQPSYYSAKYACFSVFLTDFYAFLTCKIKSSREFGPTRYWHISPATWPHNALPIGLSFEILPWLGLISWGLTNVNSRILPSGILTCTQSPMAMLLFCMLCANVWFIRVLKNYCVEFRHHFCPLHCKSGAG